MKINETFGIALLIISGLLVLGYLIIENMKLKNTVKELEEGKVNLKNLLDVIKNSKNFDNSVRNQIENLIMKFSEIDEKISKQLAKALQLLQIG